MLRRLSVFSHSPPLPEFLSLFHFLFLFSHFQTLYPPSLSHRISSNFLSVSPPLSFLFGHWSPISRPIIPLSTPHTLPHALLSTLLSYALISKTFTCLDSRIYDKYSLLHISIRFGIALEHNVDETKLGIYYPVLQADGREIRVLDVINLHALF